MFQFFRSNYQRMLWEWDLDTLLIGRTFAFTGDFNLVDAILTKQTIVRMMIKVNFVSILGSFIVTDISFIVPSNVTGIGATSEWQKGGGDLVMGWKAAALFQLPEKFNLDFNISTQAF